jgi:hypothetical protein
MYSKAKHAKAEDSTSLKDYSAFFFFFFFSPFSAGAPSAAAAAASFSALRAFFRALRSASVSVGSGDCDIVSSHSE